MAAPLSNDLRERVVTAYLEGNETYAEVAARFDVGPASVDRWVSRYRRSGSVAPDAMGGDRLSKFDAAADAALRRIVDDEPDVTRAELVVELGAQLGLQVSSSAVQRALERLRLTRKKRRSTPANATLRG